MSRKINEVIDELKKNTSTQEALQIVSDKFRVFLRSLNDPFCNAIADVDEVISAPLTKLLEGYRKGQQAGNPGVPSVSDLLIVLAMMTGERLRMISDGAALGDKEEAFLKVVGFVHDHKIMPLVLLEHLVKLGVTREQLDEQLISSMTKG